MKKILVIVLVLTLVLAFCGTAVAVKPDYTTIKDGVLTYSAGHYLSDQPLTLGYDMYGYNYQAHLFKGSYANAYLGRDGFEPYAGDTEAYLALYPEAENTWYWPYRDVYISMKWNDAWLSNADRDNDLSLDRHFGFDSYIGSGAWEMYYECTYDEFGEIDYEYRCKIVAVPSDAYKEGGIWYSAEGVEIGPDIWGQFAIIEEIENGEAIYQSPLRCGLGNW